MSDMEPNALYFRTTYCVRASDDVRVLSIAYRDEPPDSYADVADRLGFVPPIHEATLGPMRFDRLAPGNVIAEAVRTMFSDEDA